MRSAARQLARLVPVPRSVKPRLLDLSECPHCASPYVQPTEGKALPDGKVSLTLHCPDCDAWMTGTFSAERAVRVNMAQELHALAAGFARDLIGPDDFGYAAAPAGRRRR